jgi:tetratricopeptide (TPR) repeat protein
MRSAEKNPEESKADALCAEGRRTLAAGDAAQAVRCYRQALAVDDEHVEAQLGLMRALCAVGRVDQAIAVGLRLSVLAPLFAEGHRELAECFRQAGQMPQAEAATRRARVVEWKQQLAAEPADEAGE